MSTLITALPAATGVADADLLEIAHDPSGAPVSQKATNGQKRGFAVYRAILTQAGIGNPPVATILQNTIGTIVWTYAITGRYIATLVGAFPADKTLIQATMATSGVGLAFLTIVKDNLPDSFRLISYSGAVPTDGVLNGAAIEIQVYP